MKDLNELAEAIIEIQEEKALNLVRELLNEEFDPQMIFKIYQDAMGEIGRRFE